MNSGITKLERNMLKHPVPEKHLVQIGDLVVSFALLEEQLKQLVSLFMPWDESKIVTAELSFKALRALVLSLFLKKLGENDNDFIKIKAFIRRAGKIEETRNKIMHSLWAAGEDMDYITRIKATAKEGKGFQYRFEKISIKYLSDFVETIQNLAGEIQVFYIDKITGDRAKGTKS
ncbi:MAG: hypothetical protein ACO1PI_09265 [Bacteroidota bacterium]